MQVLIKYFKEEKNKIILAPLFKLLEAITELTVPIFIALIVDKGIKFSDISYIISMFGILFFIAIVGFAISCIAQYFSAQVSVSIGCKIRDDLFSHIQKLSDANLDKIETSELITNMTSDINQIQNAINLTLRLLVRSPFIVIGCFIMALIIDVKAAIIFLITIIILGIIVGSILIFSLPLYKKIQNQLDKIITLIKDNVKGLKIIRSFNEQTNEISKFQQKAKLLKKNELNVENFVSLLNPITYLVVNIAIVLLLYRGGTGVYSGELSNGQIIALYNYLAQILVELVKLVNLLITITKGIASANRIEKIIKIKNLEKPKNKNEIDTIDNTDIAIKFDKVSLKYDKNSLNSLNNINLEIYNQEMVGIIGTVASGKTSLINLIPKYYEPTSGKIFVFGKNVKSYNTDTLRNEIAFVNQKVNLFKGTIKSNLQISKKDASDEEMMEALKLACLWDFVNGTKDKLDFIVEDNGKNLSGGMRQRLLLAMALLRKAKILILDDITSALDNYTASKIKENISNLSYKPTIIITSQKISQIKHCSKIIVMDKGEIIQIGKHKDLIKTCTLYQDIYNLQLEKDDKDENKRS